MKDPTVQARFINLSHEPKKYECKRTQLHILRKSPTPIGRGDVGTAVVIAKTAMSMIDTLFRSPSQTLSDLFPQVFRIIPARFFREDLIFFDEGNQPSLEVTLVHAGA
jgi:hypothetical protein